MNRAVVIGAAIVMLVVGIASFAYTIEKCGIGRALLFGKNGVFVAAAGMCDQ